MNERAERIRQFRLKQPRAELERKAKKAVERSNLYTQEELDAADAQARDICAAIKWK
jgi:hypothetical protein